MDGFLGRNFLSDPRTLKPKKPKKNFKKLKNLKNLKKFFKNLVFSSPGLKGTPLKFVWNRGSRYQQETCNISETGQGYY